MVQRGKIVSQESGKFVPWSIVGALNELSVEELELSKGFLRAQPEKLFPGLGSQWSSLLRHIDLDLKLVSVQPLAELNDEFSIYHPFRINGEVGLLCLQNSLVLSFLDYIVPERRLVAESVVFEYLIRRFLSTIDRSWFFEEKLHLLYMPPDSAAEVEIAGVVDLELRIGGRDERLNIALGPTAVDLFRRAWQANEDKAPSKPKRMGGVGERLTIFVDLARLSVPREKSLLDYLSPGAIIDLEAPFVGVVTLVAGERVMARGKLHTFEDRFAIRVTDSKPSDSRVADNSEINIVLDTITLSSRDLGNALERGSVLLSDSPINSQVSLVIGEEVAAKAEVGLLGGNFALRVMV